MKTPHGSPIVLHLSFGGEFITTTLNRFGAEAWNRWLYAMLERIPLSWGEGEDEPPLCLWFDAEAADFSGMLLDGVDFGLVGCEGVRFDGASLKVAMLAEVGHASFRNADLREAVFVGDISGADFTGARTDGVSLVDASFDPADPPVGLPADLLGTCLAEPVEDDQMDGEPGIGLAEHPVSIRASLAESATK